MSSHTREELVQMWSAIKRIENTLTDITTEHMKFTAVIRRCIFQDIKFIKDKIEESVGQME